MADIMLRNVRLSFPDLFHAKEFKPGDGKPRWSATFLIEPGSDNDKLVRKAIAEAATEAWGAQATKVLKSIENQGNKYCYLDGDTKEYDGYAGMMFLATHRSATKMARPAIIDADKSPLTAEDGRPYAGCYVNAKVSIYGQKGENQGMRASFSAVQFYRDGDAFSAGAPTTDDFDDVTSGSDADALV